MLFAGERGGVHEVNAAPVDESGPKDAPPTTSPVAPGARATGSDAPSTASNAYEVSELPPLAATPAASEALARVDAQRKREVAGLVRALGDYRQLDVCLAALPKVEPFDVGQAVAIELVSRGIPLFAKQHTYLLQLSDF